MKLIAHAPELCSLAVVSAASEAYKVCKHEPAAERWRKVLFTFDSMDRLAEELPAAGISRTLVKGKLVERRGRKATGLKVFTYGSGVAARLLVLSYPRRPSRC